jgi:hypothetical protein
MAKDRQKRRQKRKKRREEEEKLKKETRKVNVLLFLFIMCPLIQQFSS